MKDCKKCGCKKPLECFSKDKSCKDGYKGTCKSCKANYDKTHHELNRDYDNTRRKQYRLNHLEEERRKGREWSKKQWAENREHASEMSKKYRSQVQVKEKRKVYQKEYRRINYELRLLKDREYYAVNKHIRFAGNARKRAILKKACPAWASKEKIAAFYKQSRDATDLTGIIHHVDHIIPLVNDIVCGLHNEFNLQVLTAEENLIKSNNLDWRLLKELGYHVE